MAKIINVEKSKYLNDNIQIYTSNKVGQYSKFLDKNPIFVTWLHINSAMSRSDVGTGGVNSDVGERSPIRFNRINGLPTYNLPEFKPDASYDERGYDIELDITDATLLPNTIKPIIGDYLIVALPNTIEMAFRVNDFRYNTIQSNDFYQYSADLKYTGKDLIKKFESQIVEEYETIFENIGTEDKCFILTKDVEKIQNIGKLFLELREMYFENFFDRETGTFVCKNNPSQRDYWLYDKNVERFIMDTEIYYTENDEKSVVLTCNASHPSENERLYKQTLFYAVENRTTNYLAPYPYYYQVAIDKPLSPFRIYHINCNGSNLVITNNKLVVGRSDALDSGMMKEYFSHELIQIILGNKVDLDFLQDMNPEIKHTIVKRKPRLDDSMYVKLSDEIEEDNNDSEEDIDSEFIESPVPRVNSLTYLDEVIYQYMTNRTIDIDRDKLIQYTLQVDNYTYMTFPIVMYIIMKYYDSYFNKEEL